MTRSVLAAYRLRYNRLFQKASPDTKIFFIGFNKTASTTLHNLMVRHGIRSVHWLEPDDSTNLAVEIEDRLENPGALKEYLRAWTAYSDLSLHTACRWVEGNRHFRLFDRLFPDSFFVLNDRDTEDWLLSRARHARGQLMRDACAYLSCPKAQVLGLWREAKERHVDDALEYFRGRKRFLHFRIDRDDPSLLTRFLRPSFLVSSQNWPRANRTKSGVLTA